MPFSTLLGNDRIKNLLKRAVAEERIGQGLIFAGPQGVGKYRFAIALAEALNCQEPQQGDACGQCLQCRKIAAGEHVDVSTVIADGQFIKIDQMRAMSRETQFRPFEGRRRVYIIDEADRLREEAANSILKTLEEPPASSALVLVTCKPYGLLPTIRSRCQILNFGPLAAEEIESYLTSNQKRSPEEARLLARLSRGSIGRALQIDLEEYREVRKIVLELLETMSISHDTVRLLNAAEYLGRKIEREEFEAHLDVLMVLLSDVLHIKLGMPPETLTNSDVATRLERSAEAVATERVIQWGEQFDELIQSLTHNVNRQLAMEAVLIDA